VFLDHFAKLLPGLLQKGERVRTTGVAVSDIIPESAGNCSLFDLRDTREQIIYSAIDNLHKRGMSVRPGTGI